MKCQVAGGRSSRGVSKRRMSGLFANIISKQ